MFRVECFDQARVNQLLLDRGLIGEALGCRDHCRHVLLVAAVHDDALRVDVVAADSHHRHRDCSSVALHYRLTIVSGFSPLSCVLDGHHDSLLILQDVLRLIL